VRRIEAERRQHRRDAVVEDVGHLGLLLGSQLLPAEQVDSVLRQARLQDVAKAARFLFEHGDDPLTHRQEQVALLLRGVALVARRRPDQGHPLHEELVQVRREDREELDPLEQRRALVERLLQHAPVELEPAEIAVDPGGAKAARRRDRGGAQVCHRLRRADGEDRVRAHGNSVVPLEPPCWRALFAGKDRTPDRHHFLGASRNVGT
jgi:hypothetical protein